MQHTQTRPYDLELQGVRYLLGHGRTYAVRKYPPYLPKRRSQARGTKLQHYTTFTGDLPSLYAVEFHLRVPAASGPPVHEIFSQKCWALTVHYLAQLECGFSVVARRSRLALCGRLQTPNFISRPSAQQCCPPSLPASKLSRGAYFKSSGGRLGRVVMLLGGNAECSLPVYLTSPSRRTEIQHLACKRTDCGQKTDRNLYIGDLDQHDGVRYTPTKHHFGVPCHSPKAVAKQERCR